MRTRHRGIGLVEVLVALALGTFVAIAALAVQARAASSARTGLALQELHESARAAADLLERDLRAAGHWGPAPDASLIAGRASPASAPRGAIGVDAAGCGPAVALDLARPVVGAQAGYALEPGVALRCPPGPRGHAVAGADTLTIRRARAETSVAEAGRLQLAATRVRGELFADARIPPLGPGTAVHDLEVAIYYVGAGSTVDPAVPSLRRQRLVGGAAGPRFVDEELVAGVEDLQVEFGVDGADPDETPERYVRPGEIPADATPRTVRFALRVRALQRDPSARRTTVRAYADRSAVWTSDGHRRLVVERTVFLRNLRRS